MTRGGVKSMRKRGVVSRGNALTLRDLPRLLWLRELRQRTLSLKPGCCAFQQRGSRVRTRQALHALGLATRRQEKSRRSPFWS